MVLLLSVQPALAHAKVCKIIEKKTHQTAESVALSLVISAILV